ncbi:class I SAM-dependent methyltransferase [Streptomyces sp. NPDC001714]|uniref:class I SAM-dependent methyltransferase n=1 Tax=Streptomyces sp. NPDC001714 TaxID=3364603 RepID=UPI0036B7F68F
MKASVDAASPAAAAAWDPLAGRSLGPALDGARLAEGWTRRDTLSGRLLLRALQEMGAFTEAGEERRSATLTDDLGVAPAHRSLWDALLEILVAAGHLERDGDTVRATGIVRDLAGRDLTAESAELVAAYPEVAAQVELTRICLGEYPRLLRGETKPISVLFPGWSMEKVERVYRGDPVSDRLNELVAQAVAAHVDAGAGPAPRRILEVGAGTGGTTAELLSAVPPEAGRLHYVYSDISASFLRYGRQQFGATGPGMEFRLLDIEGDLAAQGCEDGEFDVVVAANVLHATRELRPTLANVRRLLRPGGRLVLREITSPLVFTTLTFGLLEGWWRTEDADTRIPRTPLADRATWAALLAEVGFGRVAVLAPAETGQDVLGQHVIVAEN